MWQFLHVINIVIHCYFVMCCQVRVILERLVRRCGVEPVAAACPAGDQKLLSHIRKQQNRKERRKAAQGSQAGSQVRKKFVLVGSLCWWFEFVLEGGEGVCIGVWPLPVL
jgi:hypothetical protein